MDDNEIVHLVMTGFRPQAGPNEVSEIVAASIQPFRDADSASRNIGLYAVERYVLGDQGGHRFNIRLGRDPAANAPNCWVCRRPIARGDWSLELRSRWEITLIWLTWHDYCAEGNDIEQEFDLLSGVPTSQVGLA
jgi:hypothetical protein